MAQDEDRAAWFDAELSSGRYGLVGNGFRLDGKTAVVTEAVENIGLSFALGFAQSGADVLMTGRDPEQLELAVAAARRQVPDRHIEGCVADVGTTEAAGLVSAAVTQHFGGVDILINDAPAKGREGLASGTKILELPDQSFESTNRTNVIGSFRLVSALFKDQDNSTRNASVINIVSGSGLLPVVAQDNTAYGASKAALWMLTRYLARHLAPDIRVNAVCPGIVTRDGTPEKPLHEELLREVPMNRMGLPHEVVGAAIYLASDAASYTTGELIVVNGGRDY